MADGEEFGPDYDVTVTGAFRSGPIPPPAELASYEEVVPGAAKAIIDAWITESQHRRRLEERELERTHAVERRAQWLAFSFTLAALAVTALCAFLDADWAAAIIGGGTIASVTAAFLRRG